jgi:hypothetical protein
VNTSQEQRQIKMMTKALKKISAPTKKSALRKKSEEDFTNR